MPTINSLNYSTMQELDELFGTQTPDGMVEACRVTVRKGIGIGLGAIAVATGGVLLKRGAQEALNLKSSYDG